MSFLIKMMSGDSYEITDDEFKKIGDLKDKGLVFIPSIGGLINFASIETVINSKDIDTSNLTEGYLHDGSKVVKKFGTWVLASNPDIKIDPHHYPEVAKDEILSEYPFKVKSITN